LIREIGKFADVPVCGFHSLNVGLGLLNLLGENLRAFFLSSCAGLYDQDDEEYNNCQANGGEYERRSILHL